MSTGDEVVLSLPFHGTWRAEMSPARRVPSHGTDRYALTQAARARGGAGALAGNHVVLERDGRGHVRLAHLMVGSAQLAPGQQVVAGQQVGNSGNSTQPHVHVQVMDGPDAFRARGPNGRSSSRCDRPVVRRGTRPG
jgi:murein DD-endopeptidase MepM/ murein hydrolase activator NlpD